MYNESVLLIFGVFRVGFGLLSGRDFVVFSDDLSKSLYISQIIKSIKSDVGACLTSSSLTRHQLCYLFYYLFYYFK